MERHLAIGTWGGSGNAKCMFEDKAGCKKRTAAAVVSQEGDKKRKEEAVEEEEEHLRYPPQSHHKFVSIAVRAPLILSRAELDANFGGSDGVIDDIQSHENALFSIVPPPVHVPGEFDYAVSDSDARKKLLRIPMAVSPVDSVSSVGSLLAPAAASSSDALAATARHLVSSGLFITPGSKFGCNWLA
jgi:hypothetical protein